jgi:dethiobiotin synthetase
MPVICVTGIDTGIGKSYAAGLIARSLLEMKKSVITQKLVETGSQGESEDIKLHRKIMGRGLLDEDREGLTCPEIFRFPASPHLSAALEKRSIQKEKLLKSTEELASRYEYVIIEGTGGVLVPLAGTCTLLDYIHENRYPVILVTSSKLGSINHTLLTLEALRSRDISLPGLIYNCFPAERPEIEKDSRDQFRLFLRKYGFNTPVVHMGFVDPGKIEEADYEELSQLALF